ncbi:MAG: HAMP domain-containing sensor histidine kinase [Actinomycetota bacterium]
MSRRLALRWRVFSSYLVMVVVVAGMGMVAVLALTPELFASGIRNRGGVVSGANRGRSGGTGEPAFEVSTQIQEEYESALVGALLIAAAIGLVVAVVLGVIFSHRVLARLRAVQEAAHAMAAGDFGRSLPVPSEPELADLVTSINALGASLASAEQARARLVSDLAHELRNPLTTIEGYVEGLIDRVLPPTIETYSEIAAEAHRLRRLTMDLSFLSRAQEQAVEYRFVPMDLAVVARSVAERIRPQFESDGVVLQVDLVDELPVDGDGERLAQVLTNVLGNALGHTPSGGAVTLHGVRTGLDCVVEIADTGEGMTAEQISLVFDRYTRFHGGTGIGIGLNIARAITRAHHGDLAAFSSGPGGGSIFTITVPARARDR